MLIMVCTLHRTLHAHSTSILSMDEHTDLLQYRRIMCSGKHCQKVSSTSDIVEKLLIETLKFFHCSCCLTTRELVFSDQLTPDTHISPTKLFWPTKFRTLKTPDHLDFAIMTKLTVSSRSGKWGLKFYCMHHRVHEKL